MAYIFLNYQTQNNGNHNTDPRSNPRSPEGQFLKRIVVVIYQELNCKIVPLIKHRSSFIVLNNSMFFRDIAFSIILNIYFIFMSMGVFPAHISMYHVCLMPIRARRHQIP